MLTIDNDCSIKVWDKPLAQMHEKQKSIWNAEADFELIGRFLTSTKLFGSWEEYLGGVRGLQEDADLLYHN